MLIITAILALIGLIIGSITDIKTREVPDWLSYSLIISGLGISGIYSLLYSTITPILASFLGLISFGIIAVIMFKAGQWGGGDSKILMAIGALVGLELSITNFLLGFFINAMIIGGIYGILWAGIISIKNKKRFSKAANKIFSPKIKKLRNLTFLFSFVPFLLVILQPNLLFILSSFTIFLLINLMFYAYLFSKIYEKEFMIKYIDPEKLTEGDWIVEDIKINKKIICGPKDLGISLSQIKKLIALKEKGKINKIKIKEGLPFVPSFLIAFIITLLFGNLLFFLI